MLESYETESDSCLNNYQDFDKKIIKMKKIILYRFHVYQMKISIDVGFLLVISYYVRLLPLT